MPQMAPMLWLLLFFYFIMVFLMFISNFYFIYSPTTVISKSNENNVTPSLCWQW